MRSVGSELLSVAEVLAIPLVIAAAFPRAAIGFSAARDIRSAERHPASIVFLDDAAVTRIQHAVRAVSRNADSGRAYIDLISTELPETTHGPMAEIEFRRRTDAPPVVENGIPPFLPSRRAAAPVRISVEAEKETPAFTRDELLKLN